MTGWPPRFLWISGRLSLDFAQTGGSGKYESFERLRSSDDLRDWLAASRLQLRGVRVERGDLLRARRLRAAIWNAAQARLRGGRAAARPIMTINAFARFADVVPQLVKGSRGWAAGAGVSHALSTIARDAVLLFGSDDKSRLRKCANPRCPLLFVDDSRPGKRAWCTMRRCGNLRKTRRYRARSRAARKR